VGPVKARVCKVLQRSSHCCEDEQMVMGMAGAFECVA